MSQLATEYRPKTFDGVLGQDGICASLAECLEKGRSHSFIFTGPSGTGKTTLARIIATEVDGEVVEWDAATHTGVDAVRELQQMLRFKPFQHKARVIIVDECHMLSKSAWNALLKSIEEPPSFIYWAFCTTEPGKIIDTVKTRCVRYDLKSVDEAVICTLLKRVANAEELPTPMKVIEFCADRAAGSPRRGLTNLATCAECETRAEAAIMLKEVVAEGEPIEFCRALADGAPWDRLMKVLKRLGTNTNPESIRMVVVAYFSNVALGSKSARRAESALAILDAFGSPYPPGNHMYPVLVSLGRLYLGGED